MAPKKPKDDKNQTKIITSVKTENEAPDTSSSTPRKTPGVPEDEEAPDTSSSTPRKTPGVPEDEEAPDTSSSTPRKTPGVPEDEEAPDTSSSTPRKTPGVPEDEEAPDTSSSTPRKTPGVPEDEIKQEKAKNEVMKKAGTSEQADHLHCFRVKFGPKGDPYRVDCNNPGTVLQVIKSHLSQELKEKIKTPEENIVIRLGEGNDSSIVATHFPCSCVEEGECLTITTSTRPVEKKQEGFSVLPKENYSLFFIDREGGKDTKSKTDQIFNNNNIKEQFSYYCVYGEKGMTVREAVELDGRFVDDLTEFTLSDNETADLTKCTEIVDNLNGRRFQICLPKQRKSEKKDPKEQTSSEQQEQEERASLQINSRNQSQTGTVLSYAEKNCVSLKMAMEASPNKIDLKEINELLRKQFPNLKELMESRFPGNSFKKALKLKEKKFGKIQNSFSEVRTVRGLVELSESICLIKIGEKDSKKTCEGTGFMLCDKFVLTNEHVLKKLNVCTTKEKRDKLEISAVFFYENEENSKKTFSAKVVLGNKDLDYALLELNCESSEMPAGLLKSFGPVPGPNDDGGACIIGHPAGGVKKMDITCVIRKEDRKPAVTQNLEPYKDYLFTVCSINYQIERNPYADIYVTYNSFMYHVSSGSPVFDACGKVFGLHSGGFFFDCPKPGHSVIEFAMPLLTIFQHFLGELQENGREDLLRRVLEVAQGNMHLEGIISSVRLNQNRDHTHSQQPDSNDSVEEMDTSPPKK